MKQKKIISTTFLLLEKSRPGSFQPKWTYDVTDFGQNRPLRPKICDVIGPAGLKRAREAIFRATKLWSK